MGAQESKLWSSCSCGRHLWSKPFLSPSGSFNEYFCKADIKYHFQLSIKPSFFQYNYYLSTFNVTKNEGILSYSHYYRFLRQGFMKPWLALNSLWRHEWPWLSDPRLYCWSRSVEVTDEALLGLVRWGDEDGTQALSTPDELSSSRAPSLLGTVIWRRVTFVSVAFV